jgi:hypothetical protein
VAEEEASALSGTMATAVSGKLQKVLAAAASLLSWAEGAAATADYPSWHRPE